MNAYSVFFFHTLVSFEILGSFAFYKVFQTSGKKASEIQSAFIALYIFVYVDFNYNIFKGCFLKMSGFSTALIHTKPERFFLLSIF